MSSAPVRQVIMAALVAVWDESVARIRRPNEVFDPQGLPWIELRFPGSLTKRADIGDAAQPMWDETGAFMCDVYVPSGIGDDLASTIADMIWEVFAGRDISGVRCDDRLQGQAGAREPSIGGAWWGVSFGISYRYLSV